MKHKHIIFGLIPVAVALVFYIGALQGGRVSDLKLEKEYIKGKLVGIKEKHDECINALDHLNSLAENIAPLN